MIDGFLDEYDFYAKCYFESTEQMVETLVNRIDEKEWWVKYCKEMPTISDRDINEARRILKRCGIRNDIRQYRHKRKDI